MRVKGKLPRPRCNARKEGRKATLPQGQTIISLTRCQNLAKFPRHKTGSIVEEKKAILGHFNWCKISLPPTFARALLKVAREG